MQNPALPKNPRAGNIRRSGDPEGRKLLMIAVPFILFIAAFSYVPIAGWIISFFKYYPGIPLDRLEFVGFRNFQLFFSNWRQVLNVLGNTLALSALTILSMPIPIIFAILLHELRGRRLKRVVQTVSTVPYFISYVLLYLAFVTLFSPSDGMINTLLVDRLHVIGKPLLLLNDPDKAWLMQTFVYLFKNTGYNAILYLSAIAGIDPEMFDAADVDGANRFQKILHILLPGLASTFVVLLVLNLGNILSGAGFEQYYVFGNAMVLDKLEVLDTYTYKMGMVQGNFSFGTAMSMMKSLVSVVLLIVSKLAGEARPRHLGVLVPSKNSNDSKEPRDFRRRTRSRSEAQQRYAERRATRF